MEVTISASTIIQLAALLAALGSVGAVVVWCIKFVERQKKQDAELSAIRKELTVLCYSTLACLKGLQEIGCDGPVSEALAHLEKHLNKAAHHTDGVNV